MHGLREAQAAAVKRRTCRCGVRVIDGPDDVVAAIDVTVDATALTAAGECWAVLDGRGTYTYDAPAKRYARRLWLRRAGHIGTPEPYATVHTTHRCDQPLPASWLAPTPTATTATATEEPMF
jgi:hypothetical protein